MVNTVGIVPKNTYVPGMEKRSKRRVIIERIIAQLEDVRQSEEACMNNIPESLWESDAFVNAEHSADAIMDAIETLQLAY